MEYIGEHPLIGQLGNGFIILAFVASLLASISYFIAAKKDDDSPDHNSWKKLGRMGFNIHVLAILGIIVVLFYMLVNHYYEYDYINKYSNNAMPMRYILSCFWGGQEGSFLLWIFWHAVLGSILYRRAGSWEAPVMAIFTFAQLFLCSMILGVFFFDAGLGNSPFVLKRDIASGAGLLWSMLPNYTEIDAAFKDGDGLNPLLQNYWMTIHPPTLFLGFAATLVPFCYAIAGLWKKKYHEWIKPCLSWTFFGVAVLGLGILMGGAWAYESLSFGGFWAWDPVENASLVPWITLIGAGHLMLINKNKRTSLFTTYLMVFITFFLVLYSTFLTRSGVLGDSSVHSFTDSGMLMQLLIFMVLFTCLGFYMMLIAKRLKLFFLAFCALMTVVMVVMGKQMEEVLWGIPILISVVGIIVFLIISYMKYFPATKTEEKTWTREFWMFVGALILLISSIHIISETSKPIFQDLFGLQRSLDIGIEERAETYHVLQVPFAIVITILIAVGQYFNYKKTDMKRFRKRMLVSFLGSFVFTALFMKRLGFSFDTSMGVGYNWDIAMYLLLMFTSIFCVLANGDYFIRVLKGKMNSAGSSIAHIGFGLLLLGALLSQSKQRTISETPSGLMLQNLSDQFENRENVLMFRGDTMQMGNSYYAVYRDKHKEGINIYYEIDFLELLVADSIPYPGEKVFTLEPFVQLNEKFNSVAEPGTKHYATFDVFTHVRWADVSDAEADIEDNWMQPGVFDHQHIGDTLTSPGRVMVIEHAELIEDPRTVGLDTTDLAWRVHLNIFDGMFGFQNTMIELNYALKNGVEPYTSEVFVPELRTKFELSNIDMEDGGLTITTWKEEYIVLQAIVFPFINILWVGCIIMVLGSVMAVVNRVRMNRKSNGS